MDLLFDAVKQLISDFGCDRTYWIAYSGGMDSHVLLHLFARLRATYPLKICAVYVNHGVSANASDWALHCASVCSALEIDFLHQKIDAQLTIGESPENTLRQYRYDIFKQLLQADDLLLTAHHQNDQAETVLLQLLRGSGPKGLAAMPRVKSFAAGKQVRPLLDFTRDDLKQYAEQNQLSSIEDESNTNIDFTRNFLRHEVMPILKKRWPSVTKTLARTAQHCAQTQTLVDSFTQQDLESLQGTQSHTLSIKKLLLLEVSQQSYMVRAMLSWLNFPLPSTAKMQQILQTVLPARSDKAPHVHWQNVEVRRYRDDLFFLTRSLQHDVMEVLVWDDLQQPLALSSGVILQAKMTTGKGLHIPEGKVTVRFRQGGEVFRLPGRSNHHELKKLLQTWGVPPWHRDRVPLVYVNDELAAVVNYAIAEEFVARDDQVGWLL